MHAPGDLLNEVARAHRYKWTHGDELLALILEKLDGLVILTSTIHTDKKDRPNRMPTPFRYTRPEEPRPRTPKRNNLAAIRRFFGR